MSSLKLIDRGDVIIREGGFSNYAYIIEAGKFEVSRTDEGGNKQVLGILKQHDIFGEMGLLDGLPRTATVTALQNSQVTSLTKRDLLKVAESNPKVLVPLLKVLSSRLRKTLNLIDSLVPSAGESQIH